MDAERAGDQNSGAAVFPGGHLDPADARAHPLCIGLDDAQASARLGIAEGGLNYWVAAVRECFEESGLLLAVDAQGRWADLDAIGDADAVMALRQQLNDGEVDLAPPRTAGVVSCRVRWPSESRCGWTAASGCPAFWWAVTVVTSSSGCVLSSRRSSPPAYPLAPATATERGMVVPSDF